MELVSVGIGRTITLRARVNSYTQVEMSMKALGRKTKQMVLAFITAKTAECIQVTGKQTSKVGMALRSGMMDLIMREGTRKE
jgi:hypothetical protein